MLRALLILLALCISLPAAATPACRDMAMGPAAIAMPRGEAPASERHLPVSATHLCLGCVPPSDWLRAPIAGPRIIAAAPVIADIATLDIGPEAPPALPPPREG